MNGLSIYRIDYCKFLCLDLGLLEYILRLLYGSMCRSTLLPQHTNTLELASFANHFNLGIKMKWWYWKYVQKLDIEVKKLSVQ